MFVAGVVKPVCTRLFPFQLRNVRVADNCLPAAVLKWAEGNGDLEKLPAKAMEGTGIVGFCCCLIITNLLLVCCWSDAQLKLLVDTYLLQQWCFIG